MRKIGLVGGLVAVLLLATLSFSRQDKKSASSSEGNYRLVTREETKYGIRPYYETTYQLFEKTPEGERLRWQILMPNNDWAHWLHDGQVYALSKPVPGPGGGGMFWVRDICARERVAIGFHQLFSILSNPNAQLDPSASTLSNFNNGTELTLKTTEGEKIAITLLQSTSGIGSELNLVRKVGNKGDDPIGERIAPGKSMDVYMVDSDLPGQLLQLTGESTRRLIYCELSPYSQMNGRALFITSQLEVQSEPTKVFRTPGHRTLWFDFGDSTYPSRSNLIVLDERGHVIGKVDLSKLQKRTENEPARYIDFNNVYLREGGKDIALSVIPKARYLADETLIVKDSRGGQFKIQLTAAKSRSQFSINYFPISNSGVKVPATSATSKIVKSASGQLSAVFEKLKEGGAQLIVYGTMPGSDGKPTDAELYRTALAEMPSSAAISESGKVWYTFSYAMPKQARATKFLGFATSGIQQPMSFDLLGHKEFGLDAGRTELDLTQASFTYEGESEAFNLNSFPLKRYRKEIISLPGIKGRAKKLVIERLPNMPQQMEMPIIKMGG